MSVNVAVIGTGTMGADHAHRIAHRATGARLAVVADVDVDAAAAAAMPGTRIVTDPLAAIADPGVDAVLIASPAGAHFEQVLACLDVGKPVLCEKPLTTAPDTARDVVQREADRRLVQVGFMRRFDPEFVALRETIRRGVIGRPLLLHCAHRNPSVPAHFDSAMMIQDCLVHEIDAVRFLLDTEITAVTVVPSRARRGLRDPMTALFETADAQLVDVELFVNAGTYVVRVEAVGEDGTSGLGRSSSGFLEHFTRAYDLEVQAWVDAINSGAGGTGAGALDGYRAAQACAAAIRSLDSGVREPVQGQLPTAHS